MCHSCFHFSDQFLFSVDLSFNNQVNSLEVTKFRGNSFRNTNQNKTRLSVGLLINSSAYVHSLSLSDGLGVDVQ